MWSCGGEVCCRARGQLRQTQRAGYGEGQRPAQGGLQRVAPAQRPRGRVSRCRVAAPCIPQSHRESPACCVARDCLLSADPRHGVFKKRPGFVGSRFRAFVVSWVSTLFNPSIHTPYQNHHETAAWTRPSSGTLSSTPMARPTSARLWPAS